MRTPNPPATAGSNLRIWPLFALLAAGVLIPTAGVLWFMAAALDKERRAGRQRLTDAYRRDLIAAQQRIDAHWADTTVALEGVDPDRPGLAFRALVDADVCDSVVVYDLFGAVTHPAPLRPVEIATESSSWAQARRLEHQNNAPKAAAVVYESIATQTSDRNEAARALVARGRCLVKAGLLDKGLDVLTVQLAEPRYAGALDHQGRLIQPNAQLLALEAIERGLGQGLADRYPSTMSPLLVRLNDYGEPAMPSGQRLFLMQQVAEGPAKTPPFDTQAAEAMAMELLAAGEVAPSETGMQRTRIASLWRLARKDGRVTALFSQARILSDLEDLLPIDATPLGTTIAATAPGDHAPAGPVLVSVPASAHLPGWILSLRLEGDDPFATAADRQVAAYVWTGALVVAAILILAALATRLVVRHARLTRLKNDLIATVSHELKTPLASMRVLVDTLIEGRAGGEQAGREYLTMIARENERLTRLIDNFLTFSRMERNKRVMRFEPVRADELLARATEAVSDRFDGVRAKIEPNLGDNPPEFLADTDAAVTVLVNLLDNAWKYSGDEKRVRIKAWGDADDVHWEITDNGVGMSRRDARRVFERFYQVDNSLSRTTGGCGLGLSIVKFIMDAHGGRVSVVSRLGRGSTFRLSFPRKPEGAWEV